MTKLLRNYLLLFSILVVAATATAQNADTDLMALIRQQKAQMDAARAGQRGGVIEPNNPIGMQQALSTDGKAEALSAMGMAPQTTPDGREMAAQIKHASAIVFISLGMPDEDLRYFLNEGAGRSDVVFLLRGTFNNNMRETKTRLFKLAGYELPDRIDHKNIDPKDRKPMPNVFILPQAFSNYHVTSVPVVFMQDSKKKADWYQITGPLSIALAAKGIAEGHANQIVGETWPVAEDDIAERMRAAAQGYDWAGWQHTLTADLQRKFEEGHQLPYSQTDESYHVDMSVTFPTDIKDNQGRVVVKACTKVNPVENANVPGGAIIVIDPGDARQVKMARIWLKKWPAAIVMVTRYVEDGIRDLETKAVMLDSMATARLQLHVVPALLTADNHTLLVRTYAPRVEGGIQ